MLTVHVLGAGNGRPGPERDTSGLLITAAGRYTLVDCPGGVVTKLARLGLAPEAVHRIILTHDHVDHIYGLPHLIHALGIGGSVVTLPVYAPAGTLATVDAVLRAYGLVGPDYPAVAGHSVADEPLTSVIDEEIQIVASPASHPRPTLALRIEEGQSVLGLSSDGLASVEVERLCAGADVLLHDCGGVDADRESFGAHHPSAAEAADVASRAGVRRLYLTHLPPLDTALEASMLAAARAGFRGSVALAKDGDCYHVEAVG